MDTDKSWEMTAGVSGVNDEVVTVRAAVVISATFTADPLVELLALLMRETGIDLEVVLAPYGQVFQELLDRTRSFSRNPDGVNVILVRFEDWLRQENGEANLGGDRGKLGILVDDLIVALGQAVSATRAPIVVGICPSALRDGSDRETIAFLSSLEARLIDGVAALPSVHLLPRGWIETADSASIYDRESDRLGHLPYTPAFFARLATAVARQVHALKTQPRKVLVLDCDNTLWQGGVAEDGIRGVDITPQHRALQTFALAKKDAGMLLSLASKNVEADVVEIFRDRDDMILRLEDFAATRVNWLPKSENLKSLAAELNLGLDSFVFVDDNPVECAEVEANCPGVLTIRLAAGDDFAALLSDLWPLDQLQVTEEDRQRTDLYRQNRQRHHHQASATNFTEFLEGLELRIDIAKPRPEQFVRAAQLSQRTNQFNLTTRRWTEGQIAQLAQPNGGPECRVVEVKDRFGNYGLVGLVVFAVEGPRLVVDTLLLSCRALGRGVEHAMLRELGAIAQAQGLSSIVMPFVQTKKNLPAKLFVEGLPAESREDSGDESRYILAADRAAAVAYSPDQAQPGASPARATDTAGRDARSAQWNRFARDFDTPDKLLAMLDGARKRTRTLRGQLAAPRTKSERILCAIWAEELRLLEVGIQDDYFDLGGTSILAVAIFARIERELGNRLPLAVLMECRTVEALAARIDRSDEVRSLVVLEKGFGGRPLFLVHDADGETLLYRNLARRLCGRPVYGIQPHAKDGVRIVHTRVEEMAAHYVTEIRKVQPRGPYLLGGLCAGGVIAFEMARQFELSNDEARLVAVFDAADVGAPLKRHVESRRRLARLRGALIAEPLTRAPFLIASKAKGFFSYQLRSTVRRAYDRLSVALLRRHLDRGTRPPGWVRELPIRAVYSYAEAEYRPRHVLRTEIVLFRATEGAGTEQPYVQLYEDPLLGWGSRSAQAVKAIDVPGGHGSMLQEPNVATIANALNAYLADTQGTSASARGPLVLDEGALSVGDSPDPKQGLAQPLRDLSDRTEQGVGPGVVA